MMKLFVIFKGLSMKQVMQLFLESVSPTLRFSRLFLVFCFVKSFIPVHAERAEVTKLF